MILTICFQPPHKNDFSQKNQDIPQKNLQNNQHHQLKNSTPRRACHLNWKYYVVVILMIKQFFAFVVNTAIDTGICGFLIRSFFQNIATIKTWSLVQRLLVITNDLAIWNPPDTSTTSTHIFIIGAQYIHEINKRETKCKYLRGFSIGYFNKQITFLSQCVNAHHTQMNQLMLYYWK